MSKKSISVEDYIRRIDAKLDKHIEDSQLWADTLTERLDNVEDGISYISTNVAWRSPENGSAPKQAQSTRVWVEYEWIEKTWKTPILICGQWDDVRKMIENKDHNPRHIQSTNSEPDEQRVIARWIEQGYEDESMQTVIEPEDHDSRYSPLAHQQEGWFRRVDEESARIKEHGIFDPEKEQPDRMMIVCYGVFEKVRSVVRGWSYEEGQSASQWRESPVDADRLVQREVVDQTPKRHIRWICLLDVGGSSQRFAAPPPDMRGVASFNAELLYKRNMMTDTTIFGPRHSKTDVVAMALRWCEESKDAAWKEYEPDDIVVDQLTVNELEPS